MAEVIEENVAEICVRADIGPGVMVMQHGNAAKHNFAGRPVDFFGAMEHREMWLARCSDLASAQIHACVAAQCKSRPARGAQGERNGLRTGSNSSGAIVLAIARLLSRGLGGKPTAAGVTMG
jgi:hypothetical protein